MPLKNQVQLITYPDSLGGDLEALSSLLSGPLAGLFGGVHILPFYPSSADRGFSPITCTEVEPRFGTWQDVEHLAGQFELAADLIVNHVSRHSPYFQDFVQRGRRSPWADLFITLDKIWPDGRPPDEDVARIFLRRPVPPFSDIRIEESGQIERVWTTFGSPDRPEQIDIDVWSPVARALLQDLIRHLAGHRVKILRLDAAGYVVKKAGTSCFFVEPEIFEFLDWVRRTAHTLDMEILPEIHAPQPIQARLAAQGYWVYDFVLPLLILHTLRGEVGSSLKLQAYLRSCPRRQFTMLDCHDGIPVSPDVDGILDAHECGQIVRHLVERGANVSPLLSLPGTIPPVEAHQVNCTYYSALGADDDAYLAARAIQFFAPGIPQVYYVGLLAGENDRAANGDWATGHAQGRAVNRHNYTYAEIEQALRRPVTQRLLRLIRFRNRYPAFGGRFSVEKTDAACLRLRWRRGRAECRLHVDIATGTAAIRYRNRAGQIRAARV